MKSKRLTDSIKIALGWDGGDLFFDLDMMAIMVDKTNKARSTEHLVFYNQLAAFDGALLLSNDNQNGAGTGDDEELFAQLSLLPSFVDKIVIAVSLYHAGQRTFKDVEKAFVRMVNDETKEEIVRYELDEDFSDVPSVVIGDVRRADNGWRIVLTGNGVSGGFHSICAEYGLTNVPEEFFYKKKPVNKLSPLYMNKRLF